MELKCSHCGREITENQRYALLCESCRTARVRSDSAIDPLEFDHRGIRLPARSRVGGIITPQ